MHLTNRNRESSKQAQKKTAAHFLEREEEISFTDHGISIFNGCLVVNYVSGSRP